MKVFINIEIINLSILILNDNKEISKNTEVNENILTILNFNGSILLDIIYTRIQDTIIDNKLAIPAPIPPNIGIKIIFRIEFKIED